MALPNAQKRKSVTQLVAEAESQLGPDDSSTDDAFVDDVDTGLEGGDQLPAGETPPQPAAESKPTPAAAAQPAAPKGPAPAADAQPAPPPVAAAAAPAVAADPWAEYEEVTYEDADTGEKFQVRAPKTYAQKVKDGYLRRSDYSRKTSYMNRHRDTIEPLVANGQFEGIAPLIRDAIADQSLANDLVTVYNRRRMGMPAFDTPAAAAAAGAVQSAAQGTPPTQQEARDLLADLKADADVDDYTKGHLLKYLAPLAEKNARLEQEVTGWKQQQTDAQRRIQQQQTEVQQRLQVEDQATRAIQQLYPTEFNEQTPREKYQQIVNYAHNAGMFRQYGYNPGTFVLAYQAMNNPMGVPGGAVPSTAAAAMATTLEDAKRQGDALAAQAAAQTAAATSLGGAAPQAAAPRKREVPRFRDDPRNPGKKIPLSTREQVAWAAKNGVAL